MRKCDIRHCVSDTHLEYNKTMSTITMNWYRPKPTRWMRCDILTNVMGLVTIKLWINDEVIHGKIVKKFSDGVIVE